MKNLAKVTADNKVLKKKIKDLESLLQLHHSTLYAGKFDCTGSCLACLSTKKIAPLVKWK